MSVTLSFRSSHSLRLLEAKVPANRAHHGLLCTRCIHRTISQPIPQSPITLSRTCRRYCRPSFDPPDGSATRLRNSRRHASTAVNKQDEYNPPRTTLPPDLPKIDRKDFGNVFAYLWKLARTFGTFYKDGGKGIFANRKLAADARERLKKQISFQAGFDPFDQQLQATAIKANMLDRADFQLLRRHGYDIARLPIFGVLILIMGEWLPLIVPFIPYAVPLTCRIPSQVQGMRKKVEDRRRLVFRQGIEAPSIEQLQHTLSQDKDWPLLDLSQAQQTIQALRNEQLWYLSSVLNLHSRFWEAIQQQPPASMMRRRLARKLHYLAQDDLLLTRHGNAAKALHEEELRIACEERGLDVLGPSSLQLQGQLAGWLRRQKEDKGRGRAVLHMLFRRPNAW